MYSMSLGHLHIKTGCPRQQRTHISPENFPTNYYLLLFSIALAFHLAESKITELYISSQEI